MVVWIIGLSGSGKTFFAKKIFENYKNKKKIITIDGDEVRKYITYKLKYNIGDRKKNSLIISDLCRYLESKGYIVICSILSIFRSHQKRNRKIFKDYIQVYIKSSLKILQKRNNKSIYSKKNVVGQDMKFPEPFKSHIIINNQYDKNYKIYLKKIIKKINAKIN